MHADHDELVRIVNAQHAENLKITKEEAAKLGGKLGEVDARLRELEQNDDRVRFPRGLMAAQPSWIGNEIATAEGYGRFVNDLNMTGKQSIRVQAALTTDAGSAGGLIAPDRQTQVVMQSKPRLFIRGLLASGRTGSDIVEYARETGFTNQADVVSEGMEKPESDLTFEAAEAPVRTVAHWMRASKQALSDASQLAALVDSRLRYGLLSAEEIQLLFGDGTGQNLLGLVPSAAEFNPTFAVANKTRHDELLQAVAQAQAAQYTATGIVLNDIDWLAMQAIKDGEGRYVGAGPFGAASGLAWQVPVVPTPNMPAGQFLVGAFGLGAQLFDRWDVTVTLSDQHADFFIRNMVAILAEERIALAITRPEAFVYGQFEIDTES